MLRQIKSQQFHTDLGLCQLCYVLQKIVELKDFSRLFGGFLVLFKADLIFKVFSRKPSKSKYFSSLCEPWFSTENFASFLREQKIVLLCTLIAYFFVTTFFPLTIFVEVDVDRKFPPPPPPPPPGPPNDVLENDVKLKQEMEIMPYIPWKQWSLGSMHQMTYWKMM